MEQDDIIYCISFHWHNQHQEGSVLVARDETIEQAFDRATTKAKEEAWIYNNIRIEKLIYAKEE